ncbi:MAG TPA: hypothetical protein VNU71_18105 [Burkholderiaceae bacterium]|nr:hypothetical protein [Burkholderiaceae bacterium]
MNTIHTTDTMGSRRLARLCVAAAMLGLSAGASMAAAPDGGDAKARYEQERARCLSGTSGQAQETCLKEAGAALDSARKGQLNDGGTNYRENAKERCDVLSGDERRDCLARAKNAPPMVRSVESCQTLAGEAARECVARIKGRATIESGSVKGGGVLRETVTRDTVVRQVTPTEPAASAP